MHSDAATGYWTSPLPENVLSHADRLAEICLAAGLLGLALGAVAVLSSWARKYRY